MIMGNNFNLSAFTLMWSICLLLFFNRFISFSEVECTDAELCRFELIFENESFYFDFSQFSQSHMIADYPYSTSDDEVITAYFSFCGKFDSNSCGNETIICVKNSTSEGVHFFEAGTKLKEKEYVKDDGKEIFNIRLTGGKCKHGLYYSSVLSLQCDSSPNSPYLTDINECRLVFNWMMPAFCHLKKPAENSVQNFCSVLKSDKEMEALIPLFNAVYNISHECDKFVINVCDNIMLHKNLDCDLNVTSTLGETHYESVNLGTAITPPQFITRDNILLRFVEGSPCIHNSNLSFSSQINIICDNSSDEEHISIDNYEKNMCQYNFTWRTSSVCYNKRDSFPANDCFISYLNRTFMNLYNVAKSNVNADDSVSFLDLCKINYGLCPNGIICQSNGEYWFMLDMFNKVELNFLPSMNLHYNYQCNYMDNGTLYEDVFDTLYCGTVPFNFNEEKVERKCPILLKDFSFESCIIKSEEKRSVAVEEKSILDKLILLSFTIIGILMFCCVIVFLLKCRKIRQCLNPRKYSHRNTNFAERNQILYKRKDDFVSISKPVNQSCCFE